MAAWSTPPAAATGSTPPSRCTPRCWRPAHGVLVTSATLADSTLDDPFALAEMRTGAARLPDRPKTLRLASPFDYAANARALVVTDVGRDDPRQVAAAMRELFLAAGGGGARPVHRHPPPARGLRAHRPRRWPTRAWPSTPSTSIRWRSAPWSTSSGPRRTPACWAPTRCATASTCPAARCACWCSTACPGRGPDLLHKARRGRFGGKAYDDAVARGRIAQAFGRLIRRADDKGVFVMLDAAAPTRLFSSLPEGVHLERMGLVEAIEATAKHLG